MYTTHVCMHVCVRMYTTHVCMPVRVRMYTYTYVGVLVDLHVYEYI